MNETTPLTTAAVAAMLKVSNRTVQRLVEDNKLPARRVTLGANSVYMFDPDAVEAYMKRTHGDAA